MYRKINIGHEQKAALAGDVVVGEPVQADVDVAIFVDVDLALLAKHEDVVLEVVAQDVDAFVGRIRDLADEETGFRPRVPLPAEVEVADPVVQKEPGRIDEA